MMDLELPLNIDLLSSRMLIALARMIEATEDVVLLPIVRTNARPKKFEYNEYITDFDFTLLSGRTDSFESIIQDGHEKHHVYSCSLTESNLFRQGMRHFVESFLPPTQLRLISRLLWKWGCISTLGYAGVLRHTKQEKSSSFIIKLQIPARSGQLGMTCVFARTVRSG
jgi:hypothetical protein